MASRIVSPVGVALMASSIRLLMRCLTEPDPNGLLNSAPAVGTNVGLGGVMPVDPPFLTTVTDCVRERRAGSVR